MFRPASQQQPLLISLFDLSPWLDASNTLFRLIFLKGERIKISSTKQIVFLPSPQDKYSQLDKHRSINLFFRFDKDAITHTGQQWEENVSLVRDLDWVLSFDWEDSVSLVRDLDWVWALTSDIEYSVSRICNLSLASLNNRYWGIRISIDEMAFVFVYSVSRSFE